MLSVTFKPFMLSVIILNVVMLSVAILYVVMLSAVVPFQRPWPNCIDENS